MTQQLQSQFGYHFENELITEIEKVGILKKFSSGDIIIDINQPLNFIPLLLNGNIKILREDMNGNELLLYFLESGDTCAMSLTCCMGNKKSKIRAIAEKDTELIMLPVAYMQVWFQKYTGWQQYILESYQIRFNEMLEAIDTLAFMKMDERLYKYLTDKVKLTGDTLLAITHQHIAEDLHTSRVVISRLLKQLENEGKITLHRNKINVIHF
ncbi:Crp/Fnr family transcriptional regulator [Zhouia sp. PK063]|uniref:Crp/Fnr family transcriptional regulator n=1 Tax=Zhouia sp. PK063 TaxID=3373602 RepID=UPI0037B2982B